LGDGEDSRSQSPIVRIPNRTPLRGRDPHLSNPSITSPLVNDLIVTIDGPSGTGKSTVSRAVAAEVGLPHLDTGAFYRAATVAALRAAVDIDDDLAVAGVVGKATMDQRHGVMFLDGEDVSEAIRSPDVTAAVSRIAANPEVRRLLVSHQRNWVARHAGRAVVEGRDIGSVVFPDATLKIFLDARPEVRAGRRAVETGDDQGTVLEDLMRRDRLDSTRTASPLTVPENAVVIDTSDLDFEDVVARVVGLIRDQSV
jgi:cytidylate kinase